MTNTSVLDDRTAAAVRQALIAANAGRVRDACRIAEQALASGGEPAALHAMLGMLHCRSGEPENGIIHLRAAYRELPSDPIIALNLASALAQSGDYRAILTVVTEDLARADLSMRLERLRGFAAQMLEDFGAAVSSYERVVGAAPDDWESWNNLGNARRLTGDLDGSVAALRRSAELNRQSAPVRLNLATALTAGGHLDEAERELQVMAGDFPSDPFPLRELHALLKLRGREEDALAAIEEAVRRAPADLDLLLGLASHRLLLLDNDGAEAAYREVVQRDPANVLGNLGLAVVFELTNQTDRLAALVQEAEQRGADEAALNFIRAFDHRRGRRFEAGLEALARVPAALEPNRRWQLLGQLEEGAGHHDAAFAAFSRMNAVGAEDPSSPEIRAQAYRQKLRSQSRQLSGRWAESWREPPAMDERPSPAFLVGFPRSGTTLLDTMLMGHPKVEVLEEEPALRDAAQLLPPFTELPHASDEQIARARDEYLRIVADLTPMAPGKLLIDKNPLSMNLLPAIRRLFPDAKVILALRHPCDVVLSCFVSNFRLNDAMANFLSLESAAELYDLSFDFFQRARELLEIPVHELVYEKLVADPAEQLRHLLNFLDLEWSEEVLDHQKSARNRGRIKTASYAQVGEPLNRQSAGRWRNYRMHMEAVLPVMRPWAERFGYEL